MGRDLQLMDEHVGGERGMRRDGAQRGDLLWGFFFLVMRVLVNTSGFLKGDFECGRHFVKKQQNKKMS